MDNLIKWEKAQPLDYNSMRKHAPSHCSVRLYDSLGKFGSLRQAMGGKPCMVVLYEMHTSDKRTKSGVGHYVLIIAGKTPRYWTSYGYPVDFEIAATHSGTRLKKLLGTHKNSRIGYQEKEHSQTCWKWVLMRANLYKLSEKAFKKLFFDSKPQIRTHDDLISIASLCLLGADSMVGRLSQAGIFKDGTAPGRDTADLRWRRDPKTGRKVAPEDPTPVPVSRLHKKSYRPDIKRIKNVQPRDRTLNEKIALRDHLKQLENLE